MPHNDKVISGFKSIFLLLGKVLKYIIFLFVFILVLQQKNRTAILSTFQSKSLYFNP